MAHKGRIAWIDWARALGACSIVLLHVLVSTSRAVDVGAARLAVYDFVSIVCCRWAVPAFFMISGYLLLDPGRSLSWKQAGRYARRMALVLATFGLAFALMEEALGALQAHGEWLQVLPRAVVDVLTASTWDHLWYVYAILAVYLLLPLLRSLAHKIGTRGFTIFAGTLFAGVLGVPTAAGAIQSIAGVDVSATGAVLADFLAPVLGIKAATLVSNTAIGVTCTCLGSCLHGRRLTRRLVAVGVGSCALMVLLSEKSLAAGLGDAGYVFLQGSCLAALYAVFVLLALRFALGEQRLRSQSVVAKLARDSFGVYVVHPFFIHVALMLTDPLALPPGLYESLLFAGTLAASVGSTRLVRRIPLIGTLF